MATISTVSSTIQTLADLQDRLGGIPLDRIQFHPYPGTATLRDVIDTHLEKRKLCELVEGVLLEKAVGYNESRLAIFLAGLLNGFVLPRNLGIITGEAGTVELMSGLVRIPDVAFTSWDRLPGRRVSSEPIPRLAPNLAVEILSRSNTSGEMAVKRHDYFTAGVVLVWEIDPVARTVMVFTASDQSITLGSGDVLDGWVVLPGFHLPVRELFAELDQQR